MLHRISLAAFILIGVVNVGWAQDAAPIAWDGAYAGASATLERFETAFESDYGALTSDKYAETAPAIGFHGGYGRQIGPIYLGFEANVQFLAAAENGDVAIIGRLPPIAGVSSDDTISGAIVGSSLGAIIGAIDDPSTIPGSVIGSSGDAVLETNRYEAFDSQVKSVASFNARFGFPVGRFLPYFTGGLSLGAVETRYAYFTSDMMRTDRGRLYRQALGEYADSNDFAVGYNIGAGTEFAVTQHLSLQAEYVYSDLGTTKIEFANIPGEAEISNELHTARVGFSLRF